MSRYHVTGKPLAPPLESLLEGARVGDVITVELDEEQEKALVNAGAVQAAPAPAKKQETTRKQSG